VTKPSRAGVLSEVCQYFRLYVKKSFISHNWSTDILSTEFVTELVLFVGCIVQDHQAGKAEASAGSVYAAQSSAE